MPSISQGKCICRQLHPELMVRPFSTALRPFFDGRTRETNLRFLKDFVFSIRKETSGIDGVSAWHDATVDIKVVVMIDRAGFGCELYGRLVRRWVSSFRWRTGTSSSMTSAVIVSHMSRKIWEDSCNQTSPFKENIRIVLRGYCKRQLFLIQWQPLRKYILKHQPTVECDDHRSLFGG